MREEEDAGGTQELRAGREHEHLPRHRVSTTAGGRSQRRGEAKNTGRVPAKPGTKEAEKAERPERPENATRGEKRRKEGRREGERRAKEKWEMRC